MIVEYIRYALATHDGDELVAAYTRAAEFLLASPNALAWELTRCADDPQNYILRIEWDSAAGHMEGFRKSEHFRGFFAAIKPFLAEIAEMRHYEPTGVTSA